MKRVTKEDIIYFFKSCHSNFLKYEISPGLYEFSEIFDTLKTKLFSINADHVSMDAKLKVN